MAMLNRGMEKAMVIDPKKYRHLLLQEFSKKRSRNPQFSIRAFAKYLDVDHSNLSKILKGQKDAGLNYISKIEERLNLTEEILLSASNQGIQFEDLTMDVFLVVSNWYYDAILEMTKLNEFSPSVEAISKKLGLTKLEVSEAIKRLEKLGLLEITDNQWKDNSEYNTFVTNTYTSKAQQNYQIEILEKGIEAIREVPRDQRSQSSMTMAISKSQLDKANIEIKNFRRKISEILEESGDIKDDVYQLSVSLFPILKSGTI